MCTVYFAQPLHVVQIQVYVVLHSPQSHTGDPLLVLQSRVYWIILHFHGSLLWQAALIQTYVVRHPPQSDWGDPVSVGRSQVYWVAFPDSHVLYFEEGILHFGGGIAIVSGMQPPDHGFEQCLMQ